MKPLQPHCSPDPPALCPGDPGAPPVPSHLPPLHRGRWRHRVPPRLADPTGTARAAAAAAPGGFEPSREQTINQRNDKSGPCPAASAGAPGGARRRRPGAGRERRAAGTQRAGLAGEAGAGGVAWAVPTVPAWGRTGGSSPCRSALRWQQLGGRRQDACRYGDPGGEHSVTPLRAAGPHPPPPPPRFGAPGEDLSGRWVLIASGSLGAASLPGTPG